MPRKTLTVLIYLAAAATTSSLVLRHENYMGGVALRESFLVWLIFSAIPLLFVFAYPRFLFAASSWQKNRLRFAVILNSIAAVLTTFFFPRTALPFWKNPIRDNNSITIPIVLLTCISIFLVTALSLLLKNGSSLATFACVLFWPYWFVLALARVGREFENSPLYAVLYFLCFLSPAFFAFAAGALSYRPALAHTTALLGLVGAPWVHLSVRDSGLGNVWLMFNLPDSELKMYPVWQLILIILAVGLMALAIATAALRILPSRWQFRKASVCERTWPAFAVSFLILAIWFSQSVMPYRMPGAVDYSQFPILQILHVEKRGLQFHEVCVSVYGRLNLPLPFAISFTGNDRRLFQYRFRERHASSELPGALVERVRAMVHPADRNNWKWDAISPLRAWNADGWYFRADGVGLRTYTSDKGSAPPQEIIDLFYDLEKLPHSPETQSEMKDVCLGFCYDAISGLGYLYANHRCFNDGHGTVCR